MVGVGQHDSGGILGALSTLKKHWGAVGRDLAACRYTWDDIGDALPFEQFVEFVVYAPPGTATFHVVNGGWTHDTHKIADLIEVGNALLWTKTKAAHKGQRPPDFSVQRPGGTAQQPQQQHMTIGEYMRRAGLEG